MTIDPNALLMGGGIKAAKFDTLGATVVGTITGEPKVAQMTKFGTQEPDFWPSGDPKMQIVLTIQTDQRDDADDDGQRRLFIVPRMMPPVRDAVRAAGAKGLATGGRIAVRWASGTGQGEGNAKQYAAEYAAPVVDPSSLLGGSNGHQPAAPAPAASQPAAPAAAAPNGMLGTIANTPAAPLACPPGVDLNVWQGLPVEQQRTILAAMATPAATAPPF